MDKELTTIEVLTEIMQKHELDRSGLATLLGVSKSYISQIFTSQRMGGLALVGAILSLGEYRVVKESAEQGEQILWARGASDSLGLHKQTEEARTSLREQRQVTGSKESTLRVYRETDLYVPYYSQAVPAGYPNPVVNDSVLRLNMTRYLDGSAIYEVVGDSMIDAGIEQGCRVIVRLTKEFNPNGDIIMALYNGEPTVKGIVQDDSGIWLVPLNHDKAYEPWFVSSSDQFECIGVVVDIWDRPKKNDVRKVLSEYRQRTQASKE